MHLCKSGIKYTVQKTKKAKNIRITIRGDLSVLVSIPYKLTYKDAERIVEKKERWILRNIKQARDTIDTTFAYRNRKEYIRHKEYARELIQERINYFNRFYKFYYKTLSIKDLTSRWGSCSSKKNLNFNYKLIFLPPELRDYVIVHELCHLKEMNHSSSFWRLVAETLPNYAEHERALRHKGLSC